MRRLVLLLIAAFLVACDSDPGGATATSEVSSTADATPSITPRVTYLNTPTPTPAWTRPPEPTPRAEPVGHPPGTETGIAIVDAVVDAVVDAFVRGDEGALNDLIDWQVAPCVREPVNDYGPPPVCSEVQPAGDLTQYIPVSACHGGYRIPAEEEFTFQFVRNGGHLYGVRLPLEFDDPRARYVVVVSSSVGQSEYGYAFGVSERGIVNQELGCLFSPEYLWRLPETDQVVLAPPADALYGYPPEQRLSDLPRQVLTAITAPDSARPSLAQLVRWNEEGCVPFELDYVGPPASCPTGVAPGTIIPSIAVGGCHYGLQMPSAARDGYLPGRGVKPRLYGVRGIPRWFGDERARAVMVFQLRPEEGETEGYGIAVALSDEGIIGFDSGCGESAAEMWAEFSEQGGEVILPAWEVP